MEENIKQIVANYIKIPVENVHEATEIGRSVLVNSILVHRMYAAIAKEGFEINDYQEIKTYGELLNKISGSQENGNYIPVINEKELHSQTNNQMQGIGIDIEEISNLPRTDDFREEEFYKLNFTSREIAYCITHPDPYASFCGLFAAKEAIVKASNYYKNISFNKLLVDHLEDGKPVFAGFQISISHTDSIAIAVAVKEIESFVTANRDTSFNEHSQGHGLILSLSVLAIILAIVAIILGILK